MVGPFILHVPPLAHLPASARSCSRRSANDMTDWRGKTQYWRSYLVYRRLKCICTGDHDVQENFYARLGAHNGTPPPAIPFGNIQSSLIQLICHSKGKDMLQIEAQEHDPAHTLPPTMCAYAL
ncbi:hypothetical protein [Absidia glauca]|uniref:Ndc10 domain-containing protein n=1 Tax=Absidia glauca TaxID=4829 RepID=A0A168QJV1_ABSGL|nr:hypothetical protein [Absidia glauca]